MFLLTYFLKHQKYLRLLLNIPVYTKNNKGLSSPSSTSGYCTASPKNTSGVSLSKQSHQIHAGKIHLSFCQVKFHVCSNCLVIPLCFLASAENRVLRRKLIWHGNREKKGFHLVKLKTLTINNTEGGLSIRNFKHNYNSLAFMKWL